jgi:gliding motility-associated lipoprotein GldD
MKNMLILKKNSLLIMATSLLFFYSCRDIAVPKPKGYFRIDLPSKEYILFKGIDSLSLHLPLSFEYPLYGKISFENDANPEPGWFNIDFPFYKARIYLTYKNIRNDLAGLMEETYKMNVKNHISKADAIDEMLINDPDRKVYGILYDLKGNTATAVQFFVTDSTKHFLRGSLYFSAVPNPDSLAPVNEFFREDIIHMIETLKWKKE